MITLSPCMSCLLRIQHSLLWKWSVLMRLEKAWYANWKWCEIANIILLMFSQLRCPNLLCAPANRLSEVSLVQYCSLIINSYHVAFFHVTYTSSKGSGLSESDTYRFIHKNSRLFTNILYNKSTCVVCYRIFNHNIYSLFIHYNYALKMLISMWQIYFTSIFFPLNWVKCISFRQYTVYKNL